MRALTGRLLLASLTASHMRLMRITQAMTLVFKLTKENFLVELKTKMALSRRLVDDSLIVPPLSDIYPTYPHLRANGRESLWHLHLVHFENKIGMFARIREK